MQVAEVMQELEAMGNPQTKKIYEAHGLDVEVFGVKVGDMKKIVKKVKKNQQLALDLFETKNGDAMYLACLIADEKTITETELNQWADMAAWYWVGEYGVAGVAAESAHGWKLGMQWIEADQDHVSALGWSTLAGVVSTRKDEELDLKAISALLKRVQNQIADAPNRTRYTMNGFVIAVGSYVADLTDKAMAVAHSLGKVSVNMGGTACKVPQAPAYIQKIIDKGKVGNKRKKVRC